eukprot:scaffold11126_cov173-Skeletonema_menzelii.AAC.1
MPSLGIERAERESVTVISVIYQLGCIAVAFAMIIIISQRLKLSFGRAESVTVMLESAVLFYESFSPQQHQHQLVIGERLSCIAGVFSLLQHRYSIS